MTSQFIISAPRVVGDCTGLSRSAENRSEREWPCIGAAGRRGERAPGFLQAHDKTVGLDHARGPSRRARNSPEPATTAPRDARSSGARPLGGDCQSQAGTRRAARENATASAAEKPSRSAPTIRARRSRAASTVAGRPSAVERSLGFGFDVAQRQVDVERRGEELGGQPGGDASERDSVANAQTGVRRTPA